RRHTRWPRDWSSNVCSSDLGTERTVSCGPFGHGLQQQLCVEYRWSNQTECLENAECIPSSVDDIQNCGKNDRGEKRRQCTRAGRSEERRVGKDGRGRRVETE